jgi:hypothetical protein
MSIVKLLSKNIYNELYRLAKYDFGVILFDVQIKGNKVYLQIKLVKWPAQTAIKSLLFVAVRYRNDKGRGIPFNRETLMTSNSR